MTNSIDTGEVLGHELGVIDGEKATVMVLVLEDEEGQAWYAIKGSVTVNHCRSAELFTDCNLDGIMIQESFNAMAPVADAQDLAEEISDYLS